MHRPLFQRQQTVDRLAIEGVATQPPHTLGGVSDDTTLLQLTAGGLEFERHYRHGCTPGALAQPLSFSCRAASLAITAWALASRSAISFWRSSSSAVAMICAAR